MKLMKSGFLFDTELGFVQIPFADVIYACKVSYAILFARCFIYVYKVSCKVFIYACKVSYAMSFLNWFTPKFYVCKSCLDLHCFFLGMSKQKSTRFFVSSSKCPNRGERSMNGKWASIFLYRFPPRNLNKSSFWFYSLQSGPGVWHPVKTINNEGMIETDTEIFCDARFELPEGILHFVLRITWKHNTFCITNYLNV